MCCSEGWKIANLMTADAALNASVAAIGAHYPATSKQVLALFHVDSTSNMPTEAALQLGTPLWASEARMLYAVVPLLTNSMVPLYAQPVCRVVAMGTFAERRAVWLHADLHLNVFLHDTLGSQDWVFGNTYAPVNTNHTAATTTGGWAGATVLASQLNGNYIFGTMTATNIWNAVYGM